MAASPENVPGPPGPADGRPVPKAPEGPGPPVDGGPGGGTRANGDRAAESTGRDDQPNASGPEDRRNETDRPAEAPAPDFEHRWHRAMADLDNMRKRHVRELGRERSAERERVAAAFLPVLDNIDLALRHADAEPSAIVEGIRAVRDQALAVLARLGYPRQDETGAPFDPARHEVVAVVAPEDGLSPGVVVEVLRPGYGEPERQLRPAAVTVSRDPAG